MTEFINKSFSVYSGTGKEYRDNWDAIFAKKCPIDCQCLCHDTGGGVHDHHGEPCPGKRLSPETPQSP